MAPVTTEGVPVRETSREEGRKLLDRAAREMGMSGEEFAAAWDRGELRDSEDPRVVRISMLLPFAR